MANFSAPILNATVTSTYRTGGILNPVARISAVSGTGFTITGTALANANYYYTCF